MVVRLGAGAFLLMCVAQPAQAIDCGKAQTAVEKAICVDPALKLLDDALGKGYSKLKVELRPAEREMLVQSQRRWISSREGCAQSETGLTACIF